MMRHAPARRPPVETYPVQPWALVEDGFHPADLPRTETLFAVANGYVGVRGALEEGLPRRVPATFVNGFHETWPIEWAEDAYGLTTEGQSMVGVPDGHLLVLYVDQEPVDLSRGRLLSHRRSLDFRTGVLERSFEWQAPSGIHLRVVSKRFVSFEHRHLVAFRLKVTVLGGQAPLLMASVLSSYAATKGAHGSSVITDPRSGNNRKLGLKTVHADARGTRLDLIQSTRNSDLAVAAGSEHVIECNGSVALECQAEQDETQLEATIEGLAGLQFGVTKFVTYHTGPAGSAHELAERGRAGLDRALADGFDGLVLDQRKHLDEFWRRADVRVDGDDVVQQAVRWNLFQLAQATLRTNGQGVPAKGLTGQGYDGHYFWDTEMYVMPFLISTYPGIARNLLRFRYGMLDDARQQATLVSERGALFPWRTINGREASSYFHAGTAQYHINADIAYALRKYVDVTGDRDVLREFGAEILVETARLWESLGFYAPDTGAFHLHGVTGPDEYTTIVDDNAYTNLMAQQNLRFAADVLKELRSTNLAAFRDISERLHLAPAEMDSWAKAADRMFVPFDPARGVHPQDAHFLEKEVWDFDATPPDHYPLLLHYHPLVIYRRQVLKQADVVLATLLLPDRFSPQQRRANFDYYEPLTTGDSSLSHAIQGIVAAEVGEHDLAFEHFGHSLFMDLGNWAGNVEDGVHIASAAGVWLMLTHGFAGLRDWRGMMSLDPHLPSAWTSLAFNLRVRGGELGISLTRTAVTFRLEGASPLSLTVQGREIVITPGQATTVALEQAASSPERTAG